jgi:hypothetical protein
METNYSAVLEFEKHWSNYIAKLSRLDELKAMGRHGYQLRMPKKSLSIAVRKLSEFCKAHSIEIPNCV